MASFLHAENCFTVCGGLHIIRGSPAGGNPGGCLKLRACIIRLGLHIATQPQEAPSSTCELHTVREHAYGSGHSPPLAGSPVLTMRPPVGRAQHEGVYPFVHTSWSQVGHSF